LRKIGGGIEVTGRQEEEEEDVSSYWMTLRKREGTEELKEGRLDCTAQRTRFGRGYGPVVRETIWKDNDKNRG
jgi:hypothetical protein